MDNLSASSDTTFFKTKYNYLVFGLRLTFFLFISGLGLFLLFFIFPVAVVDGTDAAHFTGFVVITFSFSLVSYRLGKLLFKQKTIILIVDGKVVLKNAFNMRKQTLTPENIKGYSSTVIPTKIYTFKSLILYLNDDKIEFPQYLNWNYKSISKELNKAGVTYLGHEVYRWSWFAPRRYEF